MVTRNNSVRFANGTLVNFMDPAEGAEVTGAAVVNQNPPDSVNVGGNDQVTVTFDRDLPPLMAGDVMLFGSADMRGGGSSIEDNTVETTFGRGMFLGGLEDVVIQRNVIRNTNNAGINVSQVTVVGAGAELPSHGITIQSNSIYSVLGPAATGAGGDFAVQGAIIVDSTDPNFEFLTTPVNSNVSILNNYIADSGRSGMWIGELNYGDVNNNVITRWNEYPNLGVWGDVQFPQDFAQPLVTRFSQNLNTSNNVMQATSSLTGAVNLSPSTASPGAAGSAGSIAVQANVPDFSWTAISDSAWLTTAEGDSGTGNGTVQYEVAANTTGSPRSGTITIAGVVFTVRQGTL
jgi:hypothetical protein